MVRGLQVTPSEANLNCFHSNSSLGSPREFLEAKNSGSEIQTSFSYSVQEMLYQAPATDFQTTSVSPSCELSMTVVCTSLSHKGGSHIILVWS